ncbi:MAG: glycosyltransferase, partial [Cetobacterium sp.]
KEKLYIVGDGPYKKELEEKVKKLNLESKIKFLGSKKNPYPILKKSKGLILSSRYEGLPNVILEALVLKKSIVASDCPYGPKEILGEKSELGILFPIGNVEELVSIIKKIKFKKFSFEKIDEKIIEFSEKEIINKWNDIL